MLDPEIHTQNDLYRIELLELIYGGMNFNNEPVEIDYQKTIITDNKTLKDNLKLVRKKWKKLKILT